MPEWKLRCITYGYFIREFLFSCSANHTGTTCFRSSFTACGRGGKSRDVFQRAQLEDAMDLEPIAIPPDDTPSKSPITWMTTSRQRSALFMDVRRCSLEGSRRIWSNFHLCRYRIVFEVKVLKLRKRRSNKSPLCTSSLTASRTPSKLLSFPDLPSVL